MHDESTHSNRLRPLALQRRSLGCCPEACWGLFDRRYFVDRPLSLWAEYGSHNATALPHLQSSEDLLFAAITAWMLYWLSRRSLHTQQQTETMLRESEERLRMVTETIQEVFWLCSADKKQVFYVSPAYEHLGTKLRQHLSKSTLSYRDDSSRRSRARCGEPCSPKGGRASV